MTDRELLELAAKAADARWDDEVGAFYVLGRPEAWNPLNDDGDALRLAVKIGVSIHPLPDRVIVRYDNPNNPHPFVSLPYGGDPQAATRRAIVRVLAAIGRPE